MISLKCWTQVGHDVINILNKHCNPFILTELYLDGCEGVNDQIFECLELSKQEQKL